MSHTPIEPVETVPIATLSEVPQIWGSSRLHLAPWDGEKVLVAWALTHDDIGRVRQRDGGQLVLRLYLEKGGRAEALDQPLERWIGHALIAVPEDAFGTTAAVGYVIDGAFAHIVRADTVTRPRGTPGTGRLRMATPDGEVPTPEKGGEAPHGMVSLVVDLPPLCGRAHQDARWVVDGLLPCLVMARKLTDDGITGLGFAVSPLLLEQLAQPRLRQAVLDVFDGRLAAVDAVVCDPANSDQDRRLARQDRGALETAQALFRSTDGHLSATLRALADRGVELLTQPASDALVHRLSRDPGAVIDQLRLAGHIHAQHLGRRPTGVCLVRAGSYNGVAVALAKAELGFAILPSECIKNASAKPVAGLDAPIQAPDVPVLFYGAQRAEGDTALGAYREAGLRAARTVGEGPALSCRGNFGPYDLHRAHNAARTAAAELVKTVRETVGLEGATSNHRVLLFDGARLGAWFEADVFFAAVARQVVAEPALELVTVSTHRARGPVVQLATPDAHYPAEQTEARGHAAPSLRGHLHLAAVRLHEAIVAANGADDRALSLARGSLVMAQGLVADEDTPTLVHAVRAHLARCHALLDATACEAVDPALLMDAERVLGGFAGPTTRDSAP